MRNPKAAAYGLMGVFATLYLASMFLPGMVLFPAPSHSYSVVNKDQAMSILRRGGQCWSGPKQLELAQPNNIVDQSGNTLRHEESQQIGCRDPDKREIYSGFFILKFGWTAIFWGVFAWYANILALVALSLTLFDRNPKAAAWLAFAAVLVGLDAFGYRTVPPIDEPGPSIDYLASGYYTWELALTMLLLSQIVILREQRQASGGQSAASLCPTFGAKEQ